MTNTLRNLSSAALLALAATQAAPALALDCNNAASTMDLNECASIDKDKTEKTLNQTYQRVLQALDKRDEDAPRRARIKTALVAAQREWVKFREADCKAVDTQYEGGTIHTEMYLGCMENHAKRRIKDLEGYEVEY
jgi:uncharacterized protein YecT (DUF1311 family)